MDVLHLASANHGWHLTDAWAAVIAAVVALGSSGIGYWAGHRQVKDQGRWEHRSWRRQMRLTAYQKYLVAIDGYFDELDQWRTLTGRSRTDLQAALDKLYAALAGVRIAGPDDAYTAATNVSDVAAEVYRYLRRPIATVAPIPPSTWARFLRRMIDTQEAFVVAAAAVLDDPER